MTSCFSCFPTVSLSCVFRPITASIGWGVAACSGLGRLIHTIFNLFQRIIDPQEVDSNEEEDFARPGLTRAEMESILESESNESADRLYSFYTQQGLFGVSYTPENQPRCFEIKKCEETDKKKSKEQLKYSITFVNGINTTEEKARSYGTYLQEITNQNVTVIYNPNLSSTVANIWRYYQETFSEKITPTAILLAKNWRQTITAQRTIIHFAHSEGCAITKLALEILLPEEREFIYVTAVAPGAFIRNDLCKKITHIINPQDPVPNIDQKGRKLVKSENTIHQVEPTKDDKIMQHGFNHPSYINKIVESYKQDVEFISKLSSKDLQVKRSIRTKYSLRNVSST
jgi:hypothetical protein